VVIVVAVAIVGILVPLVPEEIGIVDDVNAVTMGVAVWKTVNA
jgi:hypothetical protein